MIIKTGKSDFLSFIYNKKSLIISPNVSLNNIITDFNIKTPVIDGFVNNRVWVNSFRRTIQALIANNCFGDYRLMFREKLRQML